MNGWLAGTQVTPGEADRFEICLAQMLWHETGFRQPVGGPFIRGKFTNHPRDRGGPTMMGVTQVVYDGWRDGNGWPRQSVQFITDDEVRALYRAHYWDLVRGDELPRGVDQVTMDYGVNSGCGKVTKVIQALLGVRVDGAMGAVTLNAIRRADPVKLVRAILDERRQYVRGLSNYDAFGKGWEIRIDREERAALATLGYSPSALAEYLPVGDDHDTAYCGGRATHEAPASMFRSKTGMTAAGVGSSALGNIVSEVASAVAQLSAGGNGVNLIALVLTLAASYTFVSSCGALIGSIYVWLERRKKLRREGV